VTTLQTSEASFTPVGGVSEQHLTGPFDPRQDAGYSPCPAEAGSPTGAGKGKNLARPTVGEPASLRRSGSRYALLWAAECHPCGKTLGWHRLISSAMRELTNHQQSWAHQVHTYGAPSEDAA
jgi:hypothetical protein